MGDLLNRVKKGSTAGKRSGGGGLLDRVRRAKVSGADRQKAVAERVAKRGPVGPTSTLGVVFADPVGDVKRGIGAYPGLGGEPLPAANEPGGALVDVSTRPIAGTAANVLEGILGSERLFRTPQDVHTPTLDTVGNIAAQLPQGVLLARGAALKAAPHLTEKGMKIAAPAIGAAVGAQQALRTEGLEDPAGVGTAALQGAGGAMLPVGTWGQVAAQFGFDATTGAAEVARRDPVLADKVLSGRATDEEMRRAVTLVGVQSVPGAIAGGGGVFARKAAKGIADSVARDLEAGRDNALRLRDQMLDEQEARLNADQLERARAEGLDLAAEIGRERKEMDFNNRYRAERLREIEAEEEAKQRILDAALDDQERERIIDAWLRTQKGHAHIQQEVHDAAMRGIPVGGKSPDTMGFMLPELGRLETPTSPGHQVPELLPRAPQLYSGVGGASGGNRAVPVGSPYDPIGAKTNALLSPDDVLNAIDMEPESGIPPELVFPDPFVLPSGRGKMVPLPDPPATAVGIDWDAVKAEQQKAKNRARAEAFLAWRKTQQKEGVRVPKEVVQPEGKAGEVPEAGGEAAGGGAPGKPQALAPGREVAVRGMAGTYRVLDTLSDGRHIIEDADGKTTTIRPEQVTSKPAKPAKGLGFGGGSPRRGRRSGFVSVPELPKAVRDVVDKVKAAFTPGARPSTLDPNGATISREIPAQAGKDPLDWWLRTRLKFLALVSDDLAGIKYAVDAMDPKVAKRVNAYIAAQMVRYSHDRASAFLRDGWTLPDGRQLGPTGGLRTIIHMPVNDKGTKVHQVLEEFEDYLIARRVVSIAETRTDSVGDKARDGTLVPDMPLDKAVDIMLRGEQQFPGFRAAGDAINSFFRAGLQYAKHQGRLTDGAIRAMIEDNEFYIPLTREVDDPDAVDPFSVRLKGSENHKVLPPIESTINAVDRIVRGADGNRVFSDLWGTAEQAPDNGWFTPMSDKDVAMLVQRLGAEDAAKIRDAAGDPVAADSAQRKLLGEARLNRMGEHPIQVGNRYLVSGYVNGKRRFAEVDPVVYDAMKALQPKTRGAIGKLFGGFRNFSGKLITYFPGFIMANMMRGMSSRALLSKRGMLKSLPFVEDIRAAKIMAEMTPEDRATMRLYRAFGPSFADESFVPERKDANAWPWERGARAYGNRKKFLRKYAPSAMRKTLRSPKDLYRWGMNVAEGAVRVPEFRGVYDAHLKANPGDTEGALRAAFEASANIGLNFRRGGTAAKLLNEYILFFNPAVQGTEQVLRALATPRNVARGFTMLGGTSIASMLLVGRDEDYKRLPDWEKDSYWYFPNPKFNPDDPDSSKFIRIPKQPGFGVFTTPIEAAMQLAFDDPNAARRLPFGEFIEETDRDKRIVDDLVNGLAMPFMKEVLDVYALDRNSFTGREFNSVFDEAVIPSERFSIYSSPTMVRAARLLSDNGVEIDPDKLEHLLGGLGQSAFDEGLRVADQYIFDDPTIAASSKRLPVVGRFLRDTPSGLNSLPVMRFFDEMERADTLNATYEAMKSRREFDRAKEFREENKKAFEQAARVKATRDFILARVKAAKVVMSSRESPEEKQRRLEGIGKAMTDRADAYWRSVGNEPLGVK